MKKDNLNKVFKDLWGEKKLDETKKTTIEKNDYKCYTDLANVLMIIPKNEELKNLIESYDVEPSDKGLKEINLNYTLKDFKEAQDEICCKYSVEYLEHIFKLIKGYNSVKIKIKNDYPLWVETDDFIVILAPRVDSEE